MIQNKLFYSIWILLSRYPRKTGKSCLQYHLFHCAFFIVPFPTSTSKEPIVFLKSVIP